MFFESLTSDDGLLNLAEELDEERYFKSETEILQRPLLADVGSKDCQRDLDCFILNDSHFIDDEIKLFGLFVISFDTKLGNIIEWKISDNLSFSQIEFKAMPSGIHSMKDDFM
jgi:hypothetical protein